MKEQYSRQSLIADWDQEKLKNGYAAIVGSENKRALTSFIAGGLAAMGVGTILLTGDGLGDAGVFGFDNNLKRYIESLNSDVSVLIHQTKFTNPKITQKTLLSTYNRYPDLIIETSNNPSYIFNILNRSSKENIPVLVGCSNIGGFLFLRSIKEGEQTVNIDNIVEQTLEFEQGLEGKINSMALASIIMDEARKVLMPLKIDVESPELYYKNTDHIEYINKNILMVGAGAIGTFAGISMAINGVRNLWIADFDNIEGGNLGSQILYYEFNKLENQKKSNVLCSRLNKISEKYCLQSCNFIPLEKKIDGESIRLLSEHKIDVIIGCVDNVYTRAVLNMLAKTTKIPLIDAGSGIFGCSILTSIPERTACLDCQWSNSPDSIIKIEAEKEIREKIKRKKEKKSCLYEPSLIIPNLMAGSIAVNRLKKIEKSFFSINFFSGDGIIIREPTQKCKENCNPYSVLSYLQKIESE